jgi:thymidylate kinase
VRNAYLERLRQWPNRMVSIDGSMPIADIQRELEKRLVAIWKK